MGEEIELSVKVIGTPDPEVEWQKDGKPIRDGRRVKVEKAKDGEYSVRIPRAESTDQGEYSCTAKNRAGKSSCSAELSVEGTSIQLIVVMYNDVGQSISEAVMPDSQFRQRGRCVSQSVGQFVLSKPVRLLCR